MVKKIALAAVVVVALFLIYVATQPSDYTVSREVTINAPAEAVFPYVNESQKMNSWNPWTEIDPNAKITFSGPEGGVGAATSWEGGDQLGTGTATVTESVPNQLVRTKLAYVKPFEMVQDSSVELTPAPGSTTRVKWSVNGHNTFVSRIFCVFMNMDEMVGGTFEKGLGKLKTMVEAGQ
ncbi:MAG: SRPBCC family protein [Oligoflexales bacterium]